MVRPSCLHRLMQLSGAATVRYIFAYGCSGVSVDRVGLMSWLFFVCSLEYMSWVLVAGSKWLVHLSVPRCGCRLMRECHSANFAYIGTYEANIPRLQSFQMG